MASAIAMVQQKSSVLMPSSPSELDRVVRFDNECVLIPEPSKRSKATKTYVLPLWKKKNPDTDADANAGSPSRVPQSPEETHVIVKVPIPRDSSTSPTTPKHVRRTSLPLTTCSIPKHDALTVPLRPCCDNCVPITEKSLKEGEEWEAKFTKGARRRRSASLDNNDGNFGFDPSRSGGGNLSTQIDLSPGTRYRSSTFALRVDEVDKRRRSQEFPEEMKLFRSVSPRSGSNTAFHSPTAGSTHTSCSVGKEVLTSSPSLDIPPRPMKSSPIQEEDEDQLFPLPSPRRTPSASPASSKAPSPNPSPNSSLSNLAPSGSGLRSGSDDMLIKALSRKSSGDNLKSGTSASAALYDTSTTATSRAQGNPQLRMNVNLNTHTHPSSVPISIPVPPSPLPASSASSSPVQSRGHSQPNPNSPYSPRSPRSSPTKTRFPSFSLPSIKDAIKGTSADMLKGVSSMGGGVVMGSM
ncbi:hypothetical protein C0992_008876 [Termitomyces sp. T32_za158]|nr:hypothetical protein C0992_008876 [Termitomyces sp. T32_za158]